MVVYATELIKKIKKRKKKKKHCGCGHDSYNVKIVVSIQWESEHDKNASKERPTSESEWMGWENRERNWNDGKWSQCECVSTLYFCRGLYAMRFLIAGVLIAVFLFFVWVWRFGYQLDVFYSSLLFMTGIVLFVEFMKKKKLNSASSDWQTL